MLYGDEQSRSTREISKFQFGQGMRYFCAQLIKQANLMARPDVLEVGEVPSYYREGEENGRKQSHIL